MALCAMLVILPATVLYAAGSIKGLRSLTRKTAALLGAGLFVTLSFTLVIEFPFYKEVGAKLNHLILDYLKWPAYMLTQAGAVTNIRIQLPLLCAALLIIGKWVWEMTWKLSDWDETSLPSRLQTAAVTALTAFVLMHGFHAKPLAPSMALDFKTNFLAQNASSGPFNLIYQAGVYPFKTRMRSYDEKKLACLIDRRAEYGKAPQDDPFGGAKFTKPNIVIIIMESFAGRVGTLGAVPSATPFFDKLAHNGVYFSNFYANTIGSDRALQAIMASWPFPPFPDYQSDTPHLHTLADYLGADGYDTMYFMYTADEGGFIDHAKADGFQREYGEKTLLQMSPTGRKYHTDKELFDAVQSVLAKEKKPFLSVIFTETNHQALRNVPDYYKKYGNSDSLRFADWALGYFFDQAKKSKYFANTVFFLVADHTPHGMYPFSQKKYHIPLLVYSPMIRVHRQDGRLASQFDIAPTILQMCGINPGPLGDDFFGSPLAERKANGLAYIVNDDTFCGAVTPIGFITGNTSIASSGIWEPMDSSNIGTQYRDYAMAVTILGYQLRRSGMQVNWKRRLLPLNIRLTPKGGGYRGQQI